MITAQELRDMGNTLSWEDYTIGTIEQQVKAQQDRNRHYLHYPLEPHRDVQGIIAILEIAGYTVRQAQGIDDGKPAIWLEIVW